MVFFSKQNIMKWNNAYYLTPNLKVKKLLNNLKVRDKKINSNIKVKSNIINTKPHKIKKPNLQHQPLANHKSQFCPKTFAPFFFKNSNKIKSSTLN